MDGSTILDLTYGFRVFLNLYFCALTVFFYFSFLTLRERFKTPVGVIALYLLRLGCILLCIPLYSLYAVKIAVSILIDFLSLHLLFRDPIPRKAIMAIFNMLLIMLSEGLFAAYAAFVMKISVPMSTNEQDLMLQLAPIILLSYALCYCIPSLFGRLWPKGGASISLSRFILLPASQVLMLGGFLYSFFLSSRPFGVSDGIITAIMVVACVAVDLVFLLIIQDLVQKKQLEEQRALQTRHYAALVEQQKNIRALRHDLANHLMAVKVLAQKDSGKAEAYIEDLTKQFREVTAIDFCENKIADAVLYGKHAEASAAGVSFTVDGALPEDAGIDELDLMSLMSNLIDNALDAAKQTEEKRVAVSLRKETCAVILKVENSITPGLIVNPKLTTKSDKQMHGLGVGISEGICKKYHGSLSIQSEDGFVEVLAMLLPEPGKTDSIGRDSMLPS